MAAIDTIEVLDNLQFTHADTADIYSVDADGQAGEAVATFPFTVDPTLSAVRVIINNNYGATGSTVHARVRATKVTAYSDAGVTKTQNTQMLEWTSIALGVIQDAGELDLSAAIETTLHIDLAVTGTTAHLGTEIIVMGRKEATVAEWTVIGRWTALAVTAIKNDLSAEAASGQKVIPTANPVAGNLDHNGRMIFVLDATVAQSEIAYQTAYGADA